MSTLLMIGGGVQQVAAVRRAQEIGFAVAVTDREPDAPAFAVSDHGAVLDGRDVEGLCAWALLHRERLALAGVFTLTELVTSSAAVAAALGWTSASLDATVRCQNKALAKRAWLASGVATPEGGIAEDVEAARKLFDALGAPVFVKPAVGFGAEGARRVDSADELEAHFRGNAPALLLERFAEGSMHDANGLIDLDGTFQPLGIWDRFFREDAPVEREIRIPTVLTRDEQTQLYALTERGVRALGVDVGPVKSDAVKTAAGFQLLEAAPRLHGPKGTLHALPLAGFDPMRAALRVIAGQSPRAEELRLETPRHVIGRALECAPGRLVRITGVEEARAVPGIEHAVLFARQGSRVRAPRSNADLPGFVFAAGADFETCERALARAFERITLEIER